MVWEKTLESPLDCKESQRVHPKGNQSWIFIGRTDAKAEAPIFWPPDVKNWLIKKDCVAGKDWRQEEKRMTGDEMFGWHHQLNGHEFEQGLGFGDGQGSLACCSPWGCRARHDWETELKETIPATSILMNIFTEYWLTATYLIMKYWKFFLEVGSKIRMIHCHFFLLIIVPENTASTFQYVYLFSL